MVRRNLKVMVAGHQDIPILRPYVIEIGSGVVPAQAGPVHACATPSVEGSEVHASTGRRTAVAEQERILGAAVEAMRGAMLGTVEGPPPPRDEVNWVHSVQRPGEPEEN